MNWEDFRTSLIVTKDAISAQLITETLAPNLTAEDATQRGIELRSDDEQWSLSCDERHSQNIEDQVKALSGILSSRVERMRELQNSGHALHIEISGTVETGAKLRLSPSALAELNTLSLPVFFKTSVPTDLQEEDPLAWLD
ncbi:hypothetical protein [Streptomyces decoyicus]